jgi:hypothetical protein
MNDREILAIAGRVIVDRGLPFTIVSVAASASGWDIRLQPQTGGAITSISIPDGRPMAVRVAIQDELEERL